MTPLIALAILVLIVGGILDAYLVLRSMPLRLPSDSETDAGSPLPPALEASGAEVAAAGFSYLGLLLPRASGADASGQVLPPIAGYVDRTGQTAALVGRSGGSLVTFRGDGSYVKTSWPPAPLFRVVTAPRAVAQAGVGLDDALVLHRRAQAEQTAGHAAPACEIATLEQLHTLLAASAPIARRELLKVVAMAGGYSTVAAICFVADFATRH